MFHTDLSHHSVQHGYDLPSHQVAHHPPPVSSCHGPSLSHHDTLSTHHTNHTNYTNHTNHSSSTSGYSCDAHGALNACVKDLNSHIVEGAVTGGIVGAVDGAGVGVLPGAVIGGFTSGMGHCAGSVYDHFSGCINW
jgi:hypothetical protein